MSKTFKRPITVTVPAETVQQFDAILRPDESRSGVITALMMKEIKRRGGAENA
jgi:metal-responsive CopG/Arc/MetJ family transcriptional regulator